MTKDYKISAFLQRIQSLQNLCSNNIKDHTTINNKSLNHNSTLPHCLLFVFGQDASRRSDKNTLSILQYLFIENELNLTDDDYEDLDELVLLIQPAAVSIIWTHAIKRKINQYFSHVPRLIEYIPSSQQEEEEMEAFEHFKCTSFKRMMLDIAQGSTVGVSLPFGCDHILEIEEWPLLQSFAIDNVVTPTGFFTHRYHAIDINPSLTKLFHTVDSGALLKCIAAIDTVVIPQTLALLSMLTSLSPADRLTTTTEDLLEPLSMIYEYGELHCSTITSITNSYDDNYSDVNQNTLLHISRKPMVLFGPDTNLLVTGAINSSGNSRNGSSKSMHAAFNTIPNSKMSLNSHFNQATSTFYHQQQQYLGDASHIILEGCEPSCSLRWCRTYFTQASIETHDLLILALESTHHRRGSGIYAIEENDSHCPLIQELALILHTDHVAINNAIANDHRVINTTDFHDGDATISLASASASSPSPSQKGLVTKTPTITGGHRLLALYVKLWHSLHSAVNHVFTTSTKSQRSIKDVCTKLKACIERLVEAKSKQLLSPSVRLEKKEDVRVFIECMDAVGNILSVNDVYLETSNQPCLIYVRVAVYDIAITNTVGMNAVAVGDTFLYSSYFSAAQSSPPSTSSSADEMAGGNHIVNNDRTSYCLTNPVSYTSWTSSTFSPSQLPQSIASPSCTTLDVLNLYTQQLLSRSRDPIMNKSLCLGRRMDDTAAAAVNNGSDSSYKVMIPLLSDNQLIPVSFADISLYTQGFVIESTTHINMLPLVVSFARNVACVWTVDIAECMKRALINSMLNKSTAGSRETANAGIDVEEFLPSGILFIIQLKDDDVIKDNSDKEEKKGDSDTPSAVIDIFSLNLHQLAFPMGYNNFISDGNIHIKGDEMKAGTTTTTSVRYIGLIMPSDSRSADTLSTTRAHWRKAMNMFDIPEHKFSDKPVTASSLSSSAFPESMYDAILSLTDLQSFGILESIAKRNSRTIRDDVECYAKSELSFSAFDGNDVNRRYKSRFGTGYYLLKSEHLLSESDRLNPFMSSLSSTVTSSNLSHRTLLVVLGHAGSGLTTVANALYSSLSNSSSSQNINVQQTHMLDMALIASEIITSASTTSSDDDGDMTSVERQSKLIATFQHAIIKHIQLSEQQLLSTTNSESSTAANIVIVPVIVSPILQTRIPDLLKVLQILYSSAGVFVISVVNASSVLALPSTDSSKTTTITGNISTAITHCNGIETWRSTLSQLCTDMDTADLLGQLLFLVDFPSPINLLACSNQRSCSSDNNNSSINITSKTYKSYFSALKAKIEENLLFTSDSNNGNNNSSGTGVRIEKLDATKPFRLDEDLIQYITLRLYLNNASKSKSQSTYEKANDIDSQSLAELSQFGVRCSCPPIIYKNPSADLISMIVTTFTFSSLFTGIAKNCNSCGYVNIANVKKVLSFLFPTALSTSTSAAVATNNSTNTGNNNQSWIAPIKSINKSYLSRLVQLAHCKVFANKKQKASIAYCINRLEEFHSMHTQQIIILRQRLFSIHGTLRTSKESRNTSTGTSCQVVHIEACTGAILTKQSAAFNNSDTLSSSQLIIQGIFTDSDERLFGDILECMLEIPLPSELSLLTAADLSQDELIKIQTKYIQIHQRVERISNKVQENFEYILSHCEGKRNDSDISDTEEDDNINTNKTNKTKSSTAQESKQHEQPKNAINEQQLTDKEKEDAKLAELPIDWSYDGMTYVNFNGSRRVLHPRIDEMVEKYLIKKNKDIARYNKMLAEVNEYI